MVDDGSDLDEILSLLRTGQFSDLLVPGFVDRKDPAQCFQLLPDVAYLQIGAGALYLRLFAMNQGDQLGMRVVTRIEHDQGVVEDEDVEAGLVSLSEFHFGEAERVSCLSLRCLLDEGSSIDAGVVKFAEFVFTGNQHVSFDPLWTFGIRIGGADAASRYRKGHPGAFGYRDEYCWGAEDPLT